MMPRSIALLIIACLLTTTAHAEITTRAVEYRHGDVVLEGYFAWDDSREGPMPGVLLIHEWWGHNEFVRQKAREIAALGYVAFALDMYGKGIRTDDPTRASQLARPFSADNYRLMRSRAAAGLDQLVRHEKVNDADLAAIGFCFGGTTALQLAYSGAKGLKAVVSFHGSLTPPRESDDEHIDAAILVLHGADDPLIPKEQFDSFTEAMKRSKADWHLIAYGGAVHSFTNPDADARNMPGVAFHEKAARRSFAHMKMFLEERLR